LNAVAGAAGNGMSRAFVLGSLAFVTSVAIGIAFPLQEFLPRGAASGPATPVAERPAATAGPAAVSETPEVAIAAEKPTPAPVEQAAAASTATTTGANGAAVAAGGGAVTAVWANDGGDKVTQDELRTVTKARPVINRLWDGKRVRLFGARNEVIGFNLVLEAANAPAQGVAVQFDRLTGPNEFGIHAVKPSDADGVFAWTDRDIELFYIRYLPIAGLSRLSYETYDERHVPERLRLPEPGKTWSDRPDHNKKYPDIAVPIELVPTFSIAARQNQSVWVDIYIPKDAPPGPYSGEILVREGDAVKYSVPVDLRVRAFTLPETPNAKTMVATSYHEVAKRYAGNPDPSPNSPEDLLAKRVMDRQMMLAHRHRISLIDDNGGADVWPQDKPRPEWSPRLSGELFTPANGYRGPGEGTGNNVFSIATYGQWQDWWGAPTRSLVWSYADRWESWFEQHAPETERFLYLADESEAFEQLEEWAGWLKNDPGSGRNLRSFATADLRQTQSRVPSLDITASWFRTADTRTWQAALDHLRAGERKKFFLYNAQRPGSGSFATEDEGVALRELAWGQYKKGIDRWFFWNATYYDDFQGGRGQTDVFNNAQTFGGPPRPDPILGMSAWNYSNGDGVLFYPGTDAIYPAESYNLAGPIASLRLKYWRRGIQDVDYLVMAAKADPQATQAIVQRLVPKVLWEYGVSDKSDPTWVRAPISWSTNPDDWEAARDQLADIIEGAETSR
jgi:hypothetical protein